MKMFIIGLFAVLLVAGCVQSNVQTNPSVAADAVEKDDVLETVVVDEPVVEEEEDSSVQVTGAFVSGTTEILSDVSCDADRVVTLTFTNTGESTVSVSEVDFIVNGQLDVSPECDADKLAAGESTLCSGLNALGAGKTNVVQAIMPDRVQALKKVTCE